MPPSKQTVWAAAQFAVSKIVAVRPADWCVGCCLLNRLELVHFDVVSCGENRQIQEQELFKKHIFVVNLCECEV